VTATGTYAPDPFEQYCDDDGNPLSSGTLTTFLAGLSTPATTYSDVNLTIANTNPISLDAAGRPTSGAIFLTPGVSYKFILKDVLGATVATRDNIAAVPLNPNVTGTWIPVIGGTTGTSGQTYVFQIGTYVKLGTLVIANYGISLSAKGTMTGVLQIQGFPFTSSVTNGLISAPTGLWQNMNTSVYGLYLRMSDSQTVAIFSALVGATTSNITSLLPTDISDTFIVYGTLIYTTAS
jgi:hypothetical protein